MNTIFVSDLKSHCHHGDTVNNRVGLGVWAFGGYCAPPAPVCYVKSLAHILPQDGNGERLLGASLHQSIFAFQNQLQLQKDGRIFKSTANSKDMPKSLIRN